jgi:hypothetical protein
MDIQEIQVGAPIIRVGQVRAVVVVAGAAKGELTENE